MKSAEKRKAKDINSILIFPRAFREWKQEIQSCFVVPDNRVDEVQVAFCRKTRKMNEKVDKLRSSAESL